jgi:predicted  nucleic acid-binding Zn-ribbon protein
LLILLGAVSFLIFQNRNIKEEKLEQNNQNAQVVANITNDLLVISRELDDKIAETRRLGGRVEILEEIKRDLEREIENLYERNTISLIKITNLSNQIQNYENTLASKDREINALRSSTESLVAQQQRMAKEKDSLERSVEAYEDTQRILEEKAGLAARLKTQKVSIYGINRRGREDQDLRLRQIEQLKIQVSVAENFAALPGNKQISISIVDPDGNPWRNPNTGSRTLASQTFLFQQEGMELSFLIEELPPLQAGTHLIRVSGDDYVMGEQLFIIK